MDAALKKSIEALSQYGKYLSGFLSASSSRMQIIALAREPVENSNLSILGDLIDKHEWGVDGIMLNLSEVNWELQKQEYLRAAANFGGTLYLVGVVLSAQEASEWWEALRSSPTPPRRLHLSLKFLSHEDPEAGWKLLDAVSKNPEMRNLTVVSSEIEFFDFPRNIPLTHLALLDVEVHVRFLQSLEEGGYRPLTFLRLSFLKHPTSYLDGWMPQSWRPSFGMLLGGKLKSLALEGFRELWPADLIAFMKQLELNKCLEYLSLAQCCGFEATPDVVASVVDALHESGLLHLDFQGTVLEGNAAIEAQLGRNEARHRQILKSYEKVPATAVRLFICGDAYAGKTTLVKSMLSPPLNPLERVLTYPGRHWGHVERTRGIEVRELCNDRVRVSLWDMAGQAEFHAFHNQMFPDPSTQGIPALFLFVWNPLDSKTAHMGKPKSANAFETSFRYWLKFIASKTRQSNVARKVIVVLTRADKMDLLRASVSESLADLKRTFEKIIQIVGIFEVDARSPTSVKVVASSIFENAMNVVQDVQVYKVCSEVHTQLVDQFVNDPILSWEAFQKICQSEPFNIEDAEIHTAIASSLHESGQLIYVQNMHFLILHINWFCQKVMGELMHFPEKPHKASVKITRPVEGFVSQHFLEEILEKSIHDGGPRRVTGAQLVQLMEAMQLCCQVPKDHATSSQLVPDDANIFIPATLRRRNTCLRWRVERNEDSHFMGRRLQCRDEDVTFLTPGLFAVIQLSFNKVFSEMQADVLLHKDYMSICLWGIEIVVEFCMANGAHVINVLVRSSDVDRRSTLKLVEDKVIRSLIQMCAQPVGNQGVELVQAVIRPACLMKLPAPSDEDEDQCVLIQHLKEDLTRQLQEIIPGQQSIYMYTWKSNKSFQVGEDPIRDLLGFEEYWEVVKSYQSSLQEVAEELRQEHNTQSAPMRMASVRLRARQEMQIDAEGQLETDIKGSEIQNVHTICNIMMTSIKAEIQPMLAGIDTKLDAIEQDIERVARSVATLQSKIMPQIQRRIEQFMEISASAARGRRIILPRLCFLTTETAGVRRRLMSTLIRDVNGVQIELFCEHRQCPHKVDNQSGIHVTTINEGALKRALPYVNGFLKVLTLVAKVGAHVVAGAGASIPDFSKIIAFVLDSPGFLDNIPGMPNMAEAHSQGMASFEGWQDWLESILRQQGGIDNSNIASKFKLRRAIYPDSLQVAWLCEKHYKAQRPFPLINEG